MRKGFVWLVVLLVVSIVVLMIGPVILQLFGLAQGGHP